MHDRPLARLGGVGYSAVAIRIPAGEALGVSRHQGAEGATARKRSGKRTAAEIGSTLESDQADPWVLLWGRRIHRRGSSSQVTGQRGDGHDSPSPFFIEREPMACFETAVTAVSPAIRCRHARKFVGHGPGRGLLARIVGTSGIEAGPAWTLDCGKRRPKCLQPWGICVANASRLDRVWSQAGIVGLLPNANRFAATLDPNGLKGGTVGAQFAPRRPDSKPR